MDMYECDQSVACKFKFKLLHKQQLELELELACKSMQLACNSSLREGNRLQPVVDEKRGKGNLQGASKT